MGNGATLLEEQIAGLQESGVVEEIALVIGYLAEQVEGEGYGGDGLPDLLDT